MKRILIKAHGIIPQNGGYIAGIGRTNIELISRFAKMNDNDIEFAIYCPTRRSIGFKHYGWDIPYYAYPFPHDLLLKINFESYYRRAFFKKDLLHITGNIDNFSKKEKMVVTIHDLFMKNDNNTWLFDKCIKKSQAIVTCSKFTKDNIIEQYPEINEDKITIIPWGINHDVFNVRKTSAINQLRVKYNIKEQYFFSCSCNNPRKNIDVVLDAFSKFCENKKDVSLVLTWNKPPENILTNYCKDIENNNIIFLPFVDDDELATLYSGAVASVFVSSFEGFGFPVIESMACGTPVITCRNTSLQEVGGPFPVYVKERDVNELVDAMDAMYDNKYLVPKSELISHADNYNWDETASRYVEFYKKVLFR